MLSPKAMHIVLSKLALRAHHLARSCDCSLDRVWGGFRKHNLEKPNSVLPCVQAWTLEDPRAFSVSHLPGLWFPSPSPFPLPPLPGFRPGITHLGSHF